VAVRFVLGPAGSGKTHHCVSTLRAQLTAQLTGPPTLIFLVPEQAALQMERALLADPAVPGLARCEVLGFRRLAHRILNDAGGPLPIILTPTSRTMVLRDLLTRCRPELKELAGVATRAGLIESLARSIVELIQETIVPERLDAAAQAAENESNASAARLHDVALIYRRYLEYLGSTHVDPEGVLDLARSRICRLPWLVDCRVWVDGFAGFTAQQSRFLIDLARHASSIEISLLVDPDKLDLAVNPDPFNLFARSERTAHDLTQAFRSAGIPIDDPLILRPAQPPRFRGPALIQLERNLCQSTPSPDPNAKTDTSVQFARCAGPRAEIAAAVRQIRRLTQRREDPLRYRDIAVILRDLEPYHDLISSALREAAIPFFIDRRRPTSHHPLVEAVRALLRMQGDASAVALPALLKTGLTPLDEPHTDLLENYLRAHALFSPEAWAAGDWKFDPFEIDLAADPQKRAVSASQREHLAAVNSSRARMLAALKNWWPPAQSHEAPRPCRDIAAQLVAVLDHLAVPQRLRGWIDAAQAAGDLDQAQEHTQVWSDLVRLLDELAAALGDTPMTPADFAEVIEAGLADFTLGLVPPTIDQVLVSSIERSRHPPIRAAFVLGFCDGQFPRPRHDDALLDQPERECLEAHGVRLQPGPRDRLLDERMLAYIAATRPSDLLSITYPIANSDGRPVQPSPYLLEFLRALGRTTTDIHDDSAEAGRALFDRMASIADLARGLGPALRLLAEKPNDPPAESGAWLAIYEHVRAHPLPLLSASLSGLAPIEYELALPPAVISDRFGREPRLSVSRLESFARCPFQHYANYLLRLRPRDEYEVAATHVGQLYHKLLEDFVNDLIAKNISLADLEDEQIATSVAGLSDAALKLFAEQYNVSPADRAVLARRGERELPPAVRSQRQRAKHGLRPKFTERRFGDDDASLPALILTTPKGRKVRLNGRIDRIDILPTEAGPRAIVFDYKRSIRKGLRLDEVFHGLALQLLAYLLVLKDNAARLGDAAIKPIGAFYLPLTADFHRVDHPSEVVSMKLDALHPLMPRGVIDFDAISHLDPDLPKGARSKLYAVHRNSEDKPGNLHNTDSIPHEDFDTLLVFVRTRLGELADQLLDGDISVAPARVGRTLVCDNCDYNSVCRFEYASGAARDLPTVRRDEILKHITGGNSPVPEKTPP